MSQTSVASDLLHSFQIFSELGIKTVGNKLSPVSISHVSLSVEEPFGDVVVYTNAVKEMFSLPVGLAMISLIFSISCSDSSPALKSQTE